MVRIVSRKNYWTYFFDKCINSDNYIQIINEFYNKLNFTERVTYYFQQDNAPAHTSHKTGDVLKKYFGNRLIKFPPRSADLTPLDFYLWGHIKQLVYKDNPKTIPELKDSITKAINSVSAETLKKVIYNMKKRAELCIEMKGEHFEHML